MGGGGGGRSTKITQTRIQEVAEDLISRRQGRGRGGAEVSELRAGDKKRYIVAPPLHQQQAGPTARASLRTIHNTVRDAIVRSEHEEGPKVLRLSALEANVLKERFPHLLIEEHIEYTLARTPLLGMFDSISVPTSATK